MSLGSRLLLLASALALGLGSPAAPAQGDPPPATTDLRLSARPAYAGSPTTLDVELVGGDGAPVAGAAVTVERRSGGVWGVVGTLTTDADGRAEQELVVARTVTDNAVRVTYSGDVDHDPASATTRLELRRRDSRVVVGGRSSVVDGHAVAVTVRWTTRSGLPVRGSVQLFRSLGGRRWEQVRTLRTDDRGRARITTSPRLDSRWRARAVGQDWVAGGWSDVHRVENRPPGEPVRLPAAAPRPRRSLPPQARGATDGPHLVVMPVPRRTWAQMTGITWHPGCPVGRSSLRLVRVNYWDYHGYVRRGEVVANVDAARAMGAALADLFDHELPIRAMYRVDRFGWGARSRGGDDYASMAAGNTSAFNCRDVTGRPGVRSPHSWGRALDLNTWENPYRSARGIVPNAWWQGHSHPRVAWRARSHAVVRLMARHGFRWTYGLGDTQHFDHVGSRARALVPPRPCDRYCD